MYKQSLNTDVKCFPVCVLHSKVRIFYISHFWNISSKTLVNMCRYALYLIENTCQHVPLCSYTSSKTLVNMCLYALYLIENTCQHVPLSSIPHEYTTKKDTGILGNDFRYGLCFGQFIVVCILKPACST